MSSTMFVEDISTNHANISIGIPQGKVPEPVLFTIHLNDKDCHNLW